VKCHQFLIAALVAITPAVCPSDAQIRTRPRMEDGQGIDRWAYQLSEPGPTIVTEGAPAPDFSWRAANGEWKRLKNLREQGSILLVFGPSEADLHAIEDERAGLAKVDVVPVAVLDRKDSAAASMWRRLHLTYPVIADPMNVIAAQFNVLGQNTLRARPAWFVLDQSGKVRALSRDGLPEHGYLRIACAALDLPSPDGTVTTGMP
jgi:peroxiredoxin